MVSQGSDVVHQMHLSLPGLKEINGDSFMPVKTCRGRLSSYAVPFFTAHCLCNEFYRFSTLKN